MTSVLCLILLGAAPPVPRDPFLPDGAVAVLGTARNRGATPDGDVAVSPDGTFLAAFAGGRLTLIDDRGRRWSRSVEGSAWGRLSVAAGGLVLGHGGAAAAINARTRADPIPLADEHLGVPVSLSQSADGKLIAVGSGNRFGASVRVLRAGGGGAVFRTTLTENQAAAAISPDGGTLAIWAPDTWSDLRIHSLPDGKLKKKYEAGDLLAAAFSPDGRRLAAIRVIGSGRWLTVWEAASGKRLRNEYIPGRPAVGPVFSPDGKTIAVGTYAGVVHQIDDRESAIATPVPVTLTSLAWGAGGLVAGGWVGGSPRAWPVRFEKRREAGHPVPLTSLAFSPDGRRLVTAASDGARVWDLATGRAGRFTEHPMHEEEGARLSALAPGGRWLLAGRHLGAALHLIDAGTGSTERRLLPPTRVERYAPLASFTPDGAAVLTAIPDEDGMRLTLLEVPSLKEKSSAVIAHDLSGLLVSPGGTMAAVWHDLEQGDGLRRLKARKAGLPWTVRVVSLADGKVLHTLETGSPPLAWADAARLAYITAKGTPVLHDVVKDGLHKLPAGGTAMAFSPCGRLMAAAGPDGVAVAELASCGVRLTLPPVDGPAVLAFSSDGGRLAVGGGAGSAAVWDLTGREWPSGEIRDAWTLLGDEDAAKAWPALCWLSVRPTEAAAMVRRNLQADAVPLLAARAVEVLERLATPEARRLLRELAVGAGGVAGEAKRALTRLEAR